MTYTCNRCQYQWTPRPKRFEQGRSKPIQCPQCQNKAWDEEKKST